MSRSLEDLLRDLLGETAPLDDDEVKETKHRGPICEGEIQIGCGGDADLIWVLVLRQLKAILCLLKHHKYGLKEIKCEIKDIEDNMDGGGEEAGPLTTGPIFIRSGQNNAINVKVQNIGDDPISAEVRLFNIGVCPPVQADSETLTNIGSCCAQDAVVTADAGDYEVVVCPTPSDAAIRVFVSVHNGSATTSAFEYVIKPAEMLPLVCPFCE